MRLAARPLHAAICALLLAAQGARPARAEEPLLAVLEFSSKLEGADAKAVDAAYFSNVVRSAALDAVPGLRVMTRENMLVLVNASGKKLEDCEGECEIDTGRRLGADLVVSGQLLKLGTKYKLDLRLHDTHQGRLLSGAQASGKTIDELDDATGAAVKKLVAAIAPAAPSHPAAANSPAGSAPLSAPAPAPAPAAAPLPADEPSLIERALSAPCSNNTSCTWQKQCRESAKDCFRFASDVDNGQFGLAVHLPTSIALFQRACDGGEQNGCSMVLLYAGIGAKGANKDLPRARAVARASCGRGNESACDYLWTRLEAQPADQQYAIDLLTKQCSGDSAQACLYLCMNDRDKGLARAQGALVELRRQCGQNAKNACYFAKTCDAQMELAR